MKTKPDAQTGKMTRNARACDACRTRKVKCDGAQPCSQCLHFDVPCIISPPGKRKNPIRGRLVAQVRGEASEFMQWEERRSSTSATPADRQYPVTSIAGIVNHGSDMPDTQFLLDLLPDFERVVYPPNPIFSCGEIREVIANMHDSHEDTALVWAYASVTTFLTQTSEIIHKGVSNQVEDMLRCSLEAHRRVDLGIGLDGRMTQEAPVSIKRIVTCMFLETSCMAFKSLERSFAFLREAITMIQVLKARQPPLEGYEKARFERIYWEAYIHERFLTISAGYPSILSPLSTGFPDTDPSVPSYIVLGFNRLIYLFNIVDSPFLIYWQELQEGRGINSDITAQWIESKQAELDEDEAGAAEADRELRESGCGGLTGFQLADLFVTRLWLRTIVWQLALSKGLLSSTPAENTHEGLSLQFPARLSNQLRNLVSRLDSVASVDTQGSGIIQKLFEITSTIADVLALPLGYGQPKREMKAQVEDFIFLVKWLFQFERIRGQQKNYLGEKVSVLQELYPVVGSHEIP